MKVRVWHKNGELKITSFSPDVDMDKHWADLIKRGEVENPYIDIEESELPNRKDEKGNFTRDNWELINGKIEVMEDL